MTDNQKGPDDDPIAAPFLGGGPDRRGEDKRAVKLAADMIFLREESRELKRRIGLVEDELCANTRLTIQVADDTKFLRELLREGSGALKFLCRLARAWRFLFRYMVLPVLATALLYYYLTHGYQFPEWFKGLAEWVK